jgi:chemotaxis protein MotB
MWIVSYADLVTLTMSFFVVLYALKSGGPEKQIETTAAIKAQFGYVPPMDSTDPLDLAVLRLMGRPVPPDMTRYVGRSQDPAKGAEGRNPEVETIIPGKEITSGGSIRFALGSAVLDAADEAKIVVLADILRGHSNVLIVKGHVSPDELTLRPDDPYGMTLSEQRAEAVAAALVEHGIDRAVLRPMPCGAYEPLKVQVYDAEALQQSRRAEVYATDKTASDYVPAKLVPVPETKPAAASEPGVH